MEKLLCHILLVLFIPYPGNSARIISPFEIARWYLDSDLVMICSGHKTDTIHISRFDSLQADGFRIQYDLIRGKYNIIIDSVLKISSAVYDLPETVVTPDFPVNQQGCRIAGKIFTGLDGNGDSVFSGQLECKDVNYNDTWFRIGEKKHIVILRHTEAGYVINYSQVYGEHVLQLLREVNKYGESFFSSVWAENLPYFPFPDENAQWNIYLEYSISEAPVDTILLRYILCGDTTVNQTNYRKLCLESGSLSEPERVLAGLIREQDKRIYYKGNDFLGFPHDGEFLLFDFNVQEGDTVWHDAGYNYTVIETIDSVEIDGQLRRRYKVDSRRNYYFDDEEYWIEGIGGIKNGLFGHITEIPTCCYHYWEHVCFSENGKTKYLNPAFDGCFPSFLFSALPKVCDSPEISIYPNPVEDLLIVDHVPAGEKFRLKVFDLTGRLILERKLQSDRNRIDLFSYEGICVVSITDPDGKVLHWQKIIFIRGMD